MEFQPAFFILILAPEFYFPLRQLGLKFHAGMTGITAATRVFEIMDEPELEKTAADSDQPQVELSTLDHIAFTNVNFEYPGRNAFGLKNINPEINAGSLTALVGKTGAGKSTIINMLLRFSQPQSGEILWNDIDIDQIPLAAYRSQIAWVPQNPFLFFDSIKNNLLVANPNASDNEIRQACAKASILEFIEALPQGFDTKIGERGSRLSGGQAQRIALARGFLKNAPIVIFDEPTANLDPKLENDLIRSLQELAKGKTVLVIAHRLKTVLTADKICFLEQGEIVEQGTHLELMKKQGRYTNFIIEQASSAFESEIVEKQL
jgi:ATP-binding cassette subfamily C protein CydD